MAAIDDVLSPGKIDRPVELSISDIYFNAVKIEEEPIQVPSDTLFEIASNPNEGGGVSETIGHPFKVLQAASKVIVNPGLVNGITITNNEINNISGTNNFVVLDIVVNSNGVSSVSLDIQSSAPNGIDFVKNGVSTSFSYPIAIVDNDRIVAQLVFNNLFFTPRIAYEEPKTSVSVGEYPNDIYYSWEATNA
jgi:hypothetical protein